MELLLWVLCFPKDLITSSFKHHDMDIFKLWFFASIFTLGNTAWNKQKTFCMHWLDIRSVENWLCVLYLTQHMLLFQMGYMQFANLALFLSQFHKANVKIFDLILIVAVKNTIITIARDKILVHWTDTMLWWNIQPGWSLSSSIMADRRVIFLNITYNSFYHLLRLLIDWILVSK